MPVERLHKIPVVFYRTRAGGEVVRDWLRSLNEADRNAIGQDLMRVQYRWPVGMPLCRAPEQIQEKWSRFSVRICSKQRTWR